jgi:hypothetical protein
MVDGGGTNDVPPPANEVIGGGIDIDIMLAPCCIGPAPPANAPPANEVIGGGIDVMLAPCCIVPNG